MGYLLVNKDYTVSNALTWGYCFKHACLAWAPAASLSQRFFHVTIAVIELIPVANIGRFKGGLTVQGLTEWADVLAVLRYRGKQIADAVKTFKNGPHREGVRISRSMQFLPS